MIMLRLCKVYIILFCKNKKFTLFMSPTTSSVAQVNKLEIKKDEFNSSFFVILGLILNALVGYVYL